MSLLSHSIYLAGPISHCTYGQATDWREAFAAMLRDLAPSIHCLSPMRGKSYLAGESVLLHDYPDTILSNQRAIMTRDYGDVLRCDLIVANFLGAAHVSIGTAMECAWGYSHRKPVIAVIEDRGNVHDHPMMRESFGFRVATLEQAAETAMIVLDAGREP